MNPPSLRSINIIGTLFGILEFVTMALLSFAVRRGLRTVAQAQADSDSYPRKSGYFDSPLP